MKITYITAGSGDNFYCENCLRDRALIKAFSQSGHDVTMIPLYLPVDLESTNDHLEVSPVFFGGINVFLQQKLSIFRKLPRSLIKIFDTRFMLDRAAAHAGSTDPTKLGDLTISMLLGEHGKQNRELDRLIDWLKLPENKPDLLILSNVLLSGIAQAVKEHLDIPICSMLQDEDGFIESLGKAPALKTWQLIHDNSEYIESFVAVSSFYKKLMQKMMDVPENKMYYCYSGLELQQYHDLKPKTKNSLTIGYLSRICPSKGFDQLVSAFIKLHESNEFKDLKLIVSGGQIGDKKFIEFQKSLLKKNQCLDKVTFLDEFNTEHRLDFLSRIDLVCVPEASPVAHGRYAIEAFAAGIPIVAPDTGVFPELLEIIPAGKTYKNNDLNSLTQTLADILRNKESRDIMSDIAKENIEKYFDLNNNAQNLIEIFSETISGYNS